MTVKPWTGGDLPANVRVGNGTLLTGDFAFKRFHSERSVGMTIGHDCSMEGVQFAVGVRGRVSIGDYCYFTNAVLLAEQELSIGSYVVIGWNTTIADSDFHPLDPAQRISDAIALSPAGDGRPRPAMPTRPVAIGDDVWIGPSVVILKGVSIGDGAWIEPGAVVTTDVPAGARAVGNPARIKARA